MSVSTYYHPFGGTVRLGLITFDLHFTLHVVHVCICAAYFTSSDNPHYAELMAVVETLSNDADRDVQYIISKHMDEFPH